MSFRGQFIQVDVRRLRFDSPLLQQHFRKMRRDINRYRHYAGYLRRVARNSIRQVRAKPGGKAWKRPSAVNSPPRSRDPMKRMKWIEYAWDMREDAMVIGPIGLHKTSTTTVPSIHEKAKRVVIKRNVYRPRQRRATSRAQATAYKRGLRSGRIPRPQPIGSTTHTAKYPPRPFMWPATKKTIDKFPKMWGRLG